jgi:hypothetical protein
MDAVDLAVIDAWKESQYVVHVPLKKSAGCHLDRGVAESGVGTVVLVTKLQTPILGWTLTAGPVGKVLQLCYTNAR